LNPQPHRLALLKESLENLHKGYGPAYLASDPLLMVHQYVAPEDQEVVGFLSAVFAYGHVPQILRNLKDILAPMSSSVYESIRHGSLARWKRMYRGYAYRFQQRGDLILLLWLIRRVLADYGSIQASFLRFYLPLGERPFPVRTALTEWVDFLRHTLRRAPGWKAIESPRGIYHLLPDPASGSPCKRWNLYLRWMARGPDGLDLGLWRPVHTRHLILPLDTHTARICRYLRLTSRAAPSWAMAEEITHTLRSLDPEDPVRYDFSIARLGILARCKKRPDRTNCVACELSRICHAEEARAIRTRLGGTTGKHPSLSGQGGSMVP
jgi:uncharacterized protein (TIGR02757 family)